MELLGRASERVFKVPKLCFKLPQFTFHQILQCFSTYILSNLTRSSLLQNNNDLSFLHEFGSGLPDVDCFCASPVQLMLSEKMLGININITAPKTLLTVRRNAIPTTLPPTTLRSTTYDTYHPHYCMERGVWQSGL